MHTYTVCVRDRERPLGWTLPLSCRRYLNYTSWLAHISHDWGLEKTWGQRLCELRAQKNRTTRLCSMFSKCSPSCRINIPKFSSQRPPPPPSFSQVWNQPSISVLVVEDKKTQICVGSLWCLVSFVLNCIGADTSLMSASCLLPEILCGFSLQLPARERRDGSSQTVLFHHLRSWYCLPHPHSLYHFTTLSASCVCVCVCTDMVIKGKKRNR